MSFLPLFLFCAEECLQGRAQGLVGFAEGSIEGRVRADGAGFGESGLAWLLLDRLFMAWCMLWTLTGLADGLVAAGQPEGVDGQLVAHGATELERDVILRNRAGVRQT